MRKTKLCELFAYENIVNEKTNKAKVLVWNNRTMLIAESNSALICSQDLCFDELMQRLISGDRNVILTFLYSALASSYENYSLQEFLDYIDDEEFEIYKACVLDGFNHYLPDKELKEELNEINEVFSKNTDDDSEFDYWASIYSFCKKQLLMTDDEFLDSTWRKISILQKEFSHNLPEFKGNKTVPADELSFI